MDFNKIVEKVLKDGRIRRIPIKYVIEILIVLDDLGIIKEIKYE